MADQTKAELVRELDRARLELLRLRTRRECPWCRLVRWLAWRRFRAAVFGGAA